MDHGIVLEQTRRLVGSRHVLSFEDPRAAAQRAVFNNESAIRPAAVVMAADVAEVQAVMRLARTLDFAVNVMPNAAGNGAQHAPRSKSSVVLDLSRLNDIEELNAESGYALLGPGVSFDQLHRHIEALQAPYWVDPDPNGAYSVSGSVADRSLGFTPYGDHLLMQCGFEVVTANGEVMRTGMGALPGSDTWQLFKYNYGPYLDGLFSRSNFGIITKLGLWLMPAPPAYRPFMVGLPNLEAAGEAVEILRPLKIGMVVPNTVVISDGAADAALVAAAHGTSGESAHAWHLYGALYGIEDNVAVTWDMVNAALRTISGATIYTIETPAPHAAWPIRARLMRGEPAYRAVAGILPPGLGFKVGAPMEAEAATEMARIVAETSADSGIAARRELQLSWRTMFLRVDIPLNEGESATAIEFAAALIERLGAAGYAVTHECAALRDAIQVAQTAEPLQHLYSALGAALDPDGLLGDYDL